VAKDTKETGLALQRDGHRWLGVGEGVEKVQELAKLL
jgi:hypothetical protein